MKGREGKKWIGEEKKREKEEETKESKEGS